jgi:peptidoglycan hydrolase-like protein with peptidoglycan-binding domain
MSGEDVRALQEILLAEEVYPEAMITGYFGSLTRLAAIRFQEKYANEILVPAGLDRGTGFVGPGTRAKLESLGGAEEKVSEKDLLEQIISLQAQLESLRAELLRRSGQ